MAFVPDPDRKLAVGDKAIFFATETDGKLVVQPRRRDGGRLGPADVTPAPPDCAPGPKRRGCSAASPGTVARSQLAEGEGVPALPERRLSRRACLGWRVFAPAKGQAGAARFVDGQIARPQPNRPA